MGFAQALAGCRAGGRCAEADRAERALGVLRQGQPDVYAAFDGDPHLSDALRQELSCSSRQRLSTMVRS